MPNYNATYLQNAADYGLGLRVDRATASLPQSTAANIFTISGNVLVTAIIGEVTTVIQTQANATKLKFTSTSPGSTTDLCGTLDITAKAVGSLFSIVGVLATAMKVTTNNLLVPSDNLAHPGLVLGAGAILLDCAASNTGSVSWSIWYVPLEDGAAITAA